MADPLRSTALDAIRRGPSSERDVVVTGLGKHFGAVQVLHDVSFTLRDGEFLTLLGPSGSGKTTSLGVIAGFVSLFGMGYAAGHGATVPEVLLIGIFFSSI